MMATDEIITKIHGFTTIDGDVKNATIAWIEMICSHAGVNDIVTLVGPLVDTIMLTVTSPEATVKLTFGPKLIGLNLK